MNPSDKDLKKEVRRIYSQCAEKPGGNYPFPVGKEFAESLGYPDEIISTVPGVVLDVFTGVSSVSTFAEFPEEGVVLDVGCGAGLDALTASKKMEKKGRIIGIDFSQKMLEIARRAVNSLEVDNIELYRGDAEDLPIWNDSVDIILVNGIFNLNPNRGRIFSELVRVLNPSGALYAAELILKEPLSADEKNSRSNWFA